MNKQTEKGIQKADNVVVVSVWIVLLLIIFSDRTILPFIYERMRHLKTSWDMLAKGGEHWLDCLACAIYQLSISFY